MTEYEIQFLNIVAFINGKSLIIMKVPIAQIFQHSINPERIVVVISSDWEAANFDTIVDKEDNIWLFPFYEKDMLLKQLKELDKI